MPSTEEGHRGTCGGSRKPSPLWGVWREGRGGEEGVGGRGEGGGGGEEEGGRVRGRGRGEVRREGMECMDGVYRRRAWK